MQAPCTRKVIKTGDMHLPEEHKTSEDARGHTGGANRKVQGSHTLKREGQACGAGAGGLVGLLVNGSDSLGPRGDNLCFRKIKCGPGRQVEATPEDRGSGVLTWRLWGLGVPYSHCNKLP